MNRNKDLNWIKDINVNMIVELGKTKKVVEEVLAWRKGTIIKLDESDVNFLKIFINDVYYSYGDILKNSDGEMLIRIQKKLLNGEELENASKNTNL